MSSSESDDFEAFLDSLRPRKEKEKFRMSSGSIDEFIVDDDQVSFCEDSSNGGSSLQSHERNIDFGVDGIQSSFLNMNLSHEKESFAESEEDPARNSDNETDFSGGKIESPSRSRRENWEDASRKPKTSSSSSVDPFSPHEIGIKSSRVSDHHLPSQEAPGNDASSTYETGGVDEEVTHEHPTRNPLSNEDDSSNFLPEPKESSDEDEESSRTANPLKIETLVSATNNIAVDGPKSSVAIKPKSNSTAAKSKRLNELRNRGSFTPRQSTASAKKKSTATPVIIFSSDDDSEDENVFLPPGRRKPFVPGGASLKENIAPPGSSATPHDRSTTPPVQNTPSKSGPRSAKKPSQILVFSDESDSDSDNDVVYLGDVPGSVGQKATGIQKTGLSNPSEFLTGMRDNDSDDGYTPLLSRISGKPDSALKDVQNRDRKKDKKPSREPRSSLPLNSTATPVRKPPKSCFTERVNHTKPATKRSDGLPPGLPLGFEKGAGFKKHRETITRMLYEYHNKTVFDDLLPADMVVEWNKRLLKTAGVTKCSSRVTTKYEDGIKCVSRTYNASISLSEKVLDTLHRLRDTLCHEMCHAAVWLIDHQNEGHGVYWKSWARKAMKAHPEMPVVRRCHSYDIAYKFSYQCMVCRKIYGRHSKSINVDKQACGLCRGKLVLLPPKKSDGTPARSRQPNKFAMFVKENYKDVQSAATVGNSTPNHADVMKALSKKFASLSATKQ